MLVTDLDTGNRLFHVHIPRTAGRFIRDMFKENPRYRLNYTQYDRLILGVSVAHMHYPFYNMFPFVKDSPKFAVCRDPFTKFDYLIQFHIHQGDMTRDEVLRIDNRSAFFKFMTIVENKMPEYSNNWWRPQYQFISPDTKIWKFEDGFNGEFTDWIRQNFGFDLQYDDKLINKTVDVYDNLEYNVTYPNNIKDLVREYWYKDYETFGY